MLLIFKSCSYFANFDADQNLSDLGNEKHKSYDISCDVMKYERVSIIIPSVVLTLVFLHLSTDFVISSLCQEIILNVCRIKYLLLSG